MGLRNVLLRINPYNHYLLLKKRRNIINVKPFTIMASNCLGGLLYNTYGLRFTSPLVNTRVNSNEFVRFILDYKAYLNENLRFFESNESFPVAMLGDITINFVHYKTQEEAESKWKERKDRILEDRLFIILNDCDGMSEKEIRSLDQSSLENIIVFTSKKISNSRSSFFLPPFEGLPCVGNTMIRSLITGEMLVERYFDFGAWFSQDKGSGIERYRK